MKILNNLFPRKEILLQKPWDRHGTLYPYQLYLTRWYLWRGKKHHLYLHKFDSADTDKRLHNHPWEWMKSWIIKGGYLEERYEGMDEGKLLTKLYRRDRFNQLGRNDYHRIADVYGTCYTIVLVPAEAIQPWGFLEEDPYDPGYQVVEDTRSTEIFYKRGE